MLVWGTVNPAGEENDHSGYFFTKSDLVQAANSGHLVGKPVKIEHKGVDIGTVVSAWQNGSGALDCVLDVREDMLEGAFTSRVVENGVCRELSLGYLVSMQNSADGQKRPVKKEVQEISIVKKGARDRCYIHGFSKSNK